MNGPVRFWWKFRRETRQKKDTLRNEMTSDNIISSRTVCNFFDQNSMLFLFLNTAINFLRINSIMLAALFVNWYERAYSLRDRSTPITNRHSRYAKFTDIIATLMSEYPDRQSNNDSWNRLSKFIERGNVVLYESHTWYSNKTHQGNEINDWLFNVHI